MEVKVIWWFIPKKLLWIMSTLKFCLSPIDEFSPFSGIRHLQMSRMSTGCLGMLDGVSFCRGPSNKSPKRRLEFSGTP